MVIGIDASNVRAGGGLTYLAQMLSAASLPTMEVRRVVVWGSQKTLARLPDRDWLTKVPVGWLDGILPFRVFWQQVLLNGMARRQCCDVLFSPGGSLPLVGSIPAVTMSQNMLPFETRECRRYGWHSWRYWKLWLLRGVQGRSFRRAAGVIFLTQYARRAIQCRYVVRRDALIPHGIEPRFFVARPKPWETRPHQPTEANPFRCLYVSIVDVYKHQDQVASAVARLRARGMHVVIDFVGPAYVPALVKLQRKLKELDVDGQFLHYRGPMAFEELHAAYASADAFVFASSCENMPNILLEAMAAGLPIACSSHGPMPEILGDAGVYFDPERSEEIANAIECLYANPMMRAALAEKAQQRACQYSWERCAQETLTFIASVAKAECVS